MPKAGSVSVRAAMVVDVSELLIYRLLSKSCNQILWQPVKDGRFEDGPALRRLPGQKACIGFRICQQNPLRIRYRNGGSLSLNPWAAGFQPAPILSIDTHAFVYGGRDFFLIDCRERQDSSLLISKMSNPQGIRPTSRVHVGHVRLRTCHRCQPRRQRCPAFESWGCAKWAAGFQPAAIGAGKELL